MYIVTTQRTRVATNKGSTLTDHFNSESPMGKRSPSLQKQPQRDLN